MPEGPEVRIFADELSAALKGKRILSMTSRLKKARAWLEKHAGSLTGRKVVDVFAYGKNLIGLIEGGYFFYSHQMMWGRWHVVKDEPPPEVDRRERARLVVDGAAAILMSAPVFELGQGDPFKKIDFLRQLGPNALTYPGQTFDKKEFCKRLTSAANKTRTIGASLLDQTIVAGLGNYLRAEIMFEAKLNPWRTIASLTKKELTQLCELVPDMTSRAYLDKATVPVGLRVRMRNDDSLVYVPGKEYGTRHYVFRRTNLPCLLCGTPIRQLRQETGTLTNKVSKTEGTVENDGDEEKTRIVYFCPMCQNVEVAAGPKKRRTQKNENAKIQASNVGKNSDPSSLNSSVGRRIRSRSFAPTSRPQTKQ